MDPEGSAVFKTAGLRHSPTYPNLAEAFRFELKDRVASVGRLATCWVKPLPHASKIHWADQDRRLLLYPGARYIPRQGLA